MPKEEDFIRPAGAARLAEVSEATIRRWVREKKIHRYEDGRGRTWLDRNEIERMVRPPAPAVTGVGA